MARSLIFQVPKGPQGRGYIIQALPIIVDRLRRRFAQFKLVAHFLEASGESFNLFLLLGQAMLTGVIPAEKRSTAFGLFETGYGIAWFLGSAAMGLLYDKSILAVVLFSVVLQIAALPVLYIANKSR